VKSGVLESNKLMSRVSDRDNTTQDSVGIGGENNT
jgi:hypothetical protein